MWRSCSTSKRRTLIRTFSSISTAPLRIKEKLNRILAENTGKPIETIAADCERDNYMTAEEAKAYGLIDKVIYQR